MLDERTVVKRLLILQTRTISQRLPILSAWLLGGFGIGLGVVLANIETVSKFIHMTHVRFALLVFLCALAVAVLSNYLTAVINSNLAATEEVDALMKEVESSGRKWDIDFFISEYRRAFLPHIAWMVDLSFTKAKAGDILFGVRLTAKLSQIQAGLVIVQCFVALIAIGGLALGLKMT